MENEFVIFASRDLEVSFFLQDASGAAINIAGMQHRFRLFNAQSGAELVNLAHNAGIAIGSAAGGRLDVVTTIGALDRQYATVELTRTDTGADVVCSFPARIARPGDAVSGYASSLIVRQDASLIVKAVAAPPGPRGPGYVPNVIPVNLAASVDDWAPAGYSATPDARQIIRVTPTADVAIRGLLAAADGNEATIENASTDFLLWIEHQRSTSAGANRFRLPQSFPAFLLPGDQISFVRLGNRWVVSSWPNQGEAMGLSCFDDFNTVANIGAGTVGQAGRFASGTFGTGSALLPINYNVNTTEKPSGVARLVTGTATNGRALIGGDRGNSNDFIVPGQGPALSVVRLAREAAVSAAEDYTLVAGFTDGHNGSHSDGAAWELRWNGTAEEWSRSRFAGGVAARSAAGSPVPDATYIWLIVFLNSNWSRAAFLVSTDSQSFSVAESVTTGLPSPSQLTSWGVVLTKVAGTTSRNASVDFGGFRAEMGVRG